MHVLTQLQKTVIQQLVDREEIVYDHLVKTQENVASMKEDIERMKEEQEAESMFKEKSLDDRACMEKSITFTC